jgi:hypothetical protein
LPSALVPEDPDKPVPSALEPAGLVPIAPAGAPVGLEPLDSGVLEPAGPVVLGPRASGAFEPAGVGSLVIGPDS